jgi:hypothetical protein
MTSILTPDYARNMRILGHSDMGGRPDGIQIMVSDGYAYVGHVFNNGFSVMDVRDPKNPKFVKHVPQPKGTWSQHVQTHGDIMLVNNMCNMLEIEEMAGRNYYSGSVGMKMDVDNVGVPFSAGIRVYDIKDRANPREIGFLEVPGLGVHRMYWDGGDWIYFSALPSGWSDDIFMIADFRDPTKPVVVSELGLPGMNLTAGETPFWDQKYRHALHHAIVKGDLACGAWRDGGVTLMDVSDRHNPKILSHDNPCPPFAGSTHNCLPLLDRGLMFVVEESIADNLEDGIKRNWIYDISVPENPVTIATAPIPDDFDYAKKPGQFGPHNLHENRVEGFQSDTLIFVTYQNAGVRVYDITDPFRPVEAAACVPPAPKEIVDRRPGRPVVIDTVDAYVDKNGLIYVTDFNAGLYIMELEGL